MPEKKATTYRCMCEICKKVYEGETGKEVLKRALDCEEKPVEQAICKIGDAVILYGKAAIILKISIEKGTHKLEYFYRNSYEVERSVYEDEICLNK